MTGLGSSRREARLNAVYEGVPRLSDSMYNALMGGVVFYGLALSYALCVIMRPYLNVLNNNWTIVVILYFLSCIAGVLMSGMSANPIISFIGYNLVVIPVGVVLSVVVAEYTELSPVIVQQALLFTAIITFCMVVMSAIYPAFFLGIGGVLFTVLTGLVVTGLVCWLLRWHTVWYSWVSVILFSLYIGYDFQRAQMFEKTLDNAIDSALDIYLDIINLFLHILRILAESKSKSRRR